MCGIVGALQYKSDMDRGLRKKILKILFTETMLKTEPRGDDATGIYQVHANGDWMLTKKGEKVTKWLGAEPNGSDPAVYQDFVDTWDLHPHEMSALVGHCRKATVGSKGQDNDDNHPFAVQVDESNAILGIHNGTLYNHEIIFDKLKEISDSHLVRQGSVDSEAIFHMLYHVSEHGTKPIDADMLGYVGKRLDGAYACIVVNSRFPEQVVVFRDGRPMEFALIAPLNIVLIASDKKFIESALEKYEFIRKWTEEGKLLPELDVEHRMLVEKNYRLFDLTKEFPKTVAWKTLDDISETGVMLKSLADIEKDWKKTTTNTSTYYPNNRSNAYSKGTSTTTGPKITKNQGTNALPANASSKKSDGDKDTGTVVTAEVNSVELGSKKEAAKSHFQRAKLLGLCPSYDMNREVAAAIGVQESQLNITPITDIANKISQTHFNYGYAVALVDTKQETEDIRKKAREQHSNMEKVAEKQKRAQDHIWELKQIIVTSFALAEGGYPISLKNIELVINGYCEYAPGRKKDIIKVAKTLFSDQTAEKQVNELVAEFNRNKKNDQSVSSNE